VLDQSATGLPLPCRPTLPCRLLGSADRGAGELSEPESASRSAFARRYLRAKRVLAASISPGSAVSAEESSSSSSLSSSSSPSSSSSSLSLSDGAIATVDMRKRSAGRKALPMTCNGWMSAEQQNNIPRNMG
jgi:hypothetical protein